MMLKSLLSLVLTVCLPLCVLAQEAEPKAQEAGAIAKFEGDPNDSAALRKYAGEVFGEIAGLLQTEKLDTAEAKLDALEKFAKDLELTDDKAKTTQDRITGAVGFFRKRLDLARVSLDDLKKSLEESHGNWLQD